MNKFIDWFTRKRLLFVSFIFSILIFPAIYLADKSKSFRIENIYEGLIYILVFFIPVLIFTFINMFLKDQTFYSWKRITLIYLLIYSFGVIITPSHCDTYFRLCKETIFFFLIPLYIIISIILIVYKSLKKE